MDLIGGELSEASLALAFAAIAFAAMVKGAIGFGFPLIAVPILANVLDPRTAVVVMSVPVLLSNVLIIVRGGGTRAGARRMLLLLGTLIAGTLLGAQLLAMLDVAVLSLLVGAVSVGFVGLTLLRPNLAMPAKKERYLAPVTGVSAGLLGGTTNIYGPVLVAYLHTLHLSRKEFVFTISLLFSLAGITQVASYSQLGLYSGSIPLYALLACVPMVLGVQLGLTVQNRLPARLWNGLVLTVILLSGVNLIVRGLLG